MPAFDNALRNRSSDHAGQTQVTPLHVVAAVRRSLGGTLALDPCTTAENPCRAQRYYTIEDDGLTQPWDAATIYVNPPYGQARIRWVERCVDAGAAGSKVVLLMPSATDTRPFHRALRSADAVVFVQSRLRFGQYRGNRKFVEATHASVLFGWGTDLGPCAKLGTAVSLTGGADGG